MCRCLQGPLNYAFKRSLQIAQPWQGLPSWSFRCFWHIPCISVGYPRLTYCFRSVVGPSCWNPCLLRASASRIPYRLDFGYLDLIRASPGLPTTGSPMPAIVTNIIHIIKLSKFLTAKAGNANSAHCRDRILASRKLTCGISLEVYRRQHASGWFGKLGLHCCQSRSTETPRTFRISSSTMQECPLDSPYNFHTEYTLNPSN